MSILVRNEHQVQHEKNVEILRREAELAVPGLIGLGLGIATETPLVIGDGADRNFVAVGGVLRIGISAYV